MAILVGWALAVPALWWSGWWWSHVHRYDGCQLVLTMGPEPFWVCPADEIEVEIEKPKEAEDV